MVKQKRWSEEDLASTSVGKRNKPGQHQATKGKSKGRYGNVNKPIHDGIRFDSKREFLRYMDLKVLERAGEISDLRVHPEFPIIIGGVPIMTSSNQHNKWDRQVIYEADFTYLTKAPFGNRVIEDVKMQSGHRTDVYKLKRALMKAMGYDITEY